MSPLLIILLVILAFALFGGGWGYHTGGFAGNSFVGPGIGVVGIVVIVLIVLALTGRL